MGREKLTCEAGYKNLKKKKVRSEFRTSPAILELHVTEISRERGQEGHIN